MKKTICLIAITIILTGCGDNMPPKCDSKETKNLLNQIIQKNINNDYDAKNKISTFTVTGHEELDSHENAKEYTCEARLVIHYKNGEMDSDLISYSVFSDNSNKGQFYVQIFE